MVYLCQYPAMVVVLESESLGKTRGIVLPQDTTRRPSVGPGVTVVRFGMLILVSS